MLPSMDNLSYKERLQKLKLPTLVYRRLRGDMIEVYKILHAIYDMKVSPCLTTRSSETSRVLRGHNLYLVKERSQKKTKKRIIYAESPGIRFLQMSLMRLV